MMLDGVTEDLSEDLDRFGLSQSIYNNTMLHEFPVTTGSVDCFPFWPRDKISSHFFPETHLYIPSGKLT